MSEYVHGYSPRETQRLQEQALILEELLHSGTTFPAGSKVLESGCGVGGQTALLARRSPEAEFCSLDIAEISLGEARAYVEREGLANVRFQQGDIMHIPFEEEAFDHVFCCFVLEHLARPLEALAELKRVLVPGGTLTVIEGDHGSCFWCPETAASLEVWDAMIRAQEYLGHDPLIGRRLYPLLRQAGFRVEGVVPRWVYADESRPELMDGMVNKIIVPMVQTAREKSLELGWLDEAAWLQGTRDLERSGMPPEGTFFYAWFKGVGVKEALSRREDLK